MWIEALKTFGLVFAGTVVGAYIAIVLAFGVIQPIVHKIFDDN